MISFTIPGQPVAKGRPRLGRYATYTPTKTVNYEVLVKEFFMINRQPKLCGIFRADIKCYFTIPKNTSKKNRQLMNLGIIRPGKKPDIDNVTKIILDSLNGIGYDDDSAVVELHGYKYYSDNPRVEVDIQKLNKN